jgi:hypothetical protein
VQLFIPTTQVYSFVDNGSMFTSNGGCGRQNVFVILFAFDVVVRLAHGFGWLRQTHAL